jgi:ureidoglycolate hydrolase
LSNVNSPFSHALKPFRASCSLRQDLMVRHPVGTDTYLPFNSNKALRVLSEAKEIKQNPGIIMCL